jgi:hypothetical protein
MRQGPTPKQDRQFQLKRNLISPLKSFSGINPKNHSSPFFALQHTKPAFHRLSLAAAQGVCYLDICPCRKPVSDNTV